MHTLKNEPSIIKCTHNLNVPENLSLFLVTYYVRSNLMAFIMPNVIYSLEELVYSEDILCARHWIYDDEQKTDRALSPCIYHSLVGNTDIKQAS